MSVLRIGLTTKITVPFVILFTLLLSILGFVLTRAIFNDIESHIVQRLRFTLAVAKHERCQLPGFWETLRERAAGEDASFESLQLIGLEDGKPVLSTLDQSGTKAKELLKSLTDQISDVAIFPGLIKPEHPETPDPENTKPPSEAEVLKLIESGELAIGVEKTGEILVTYCTLNAQSYLILYGSGFSPRLKRKNQRDTRAWREFFLLYPNQQIEAAQNSALNRIVVFGCIGILMAILLGSLVARLVTRPVRRLASSAEQISSSEKLEALSFDTAAAQDEIGDLSRALQSMVDRLQNSQQERLKGERLAAAGKLAASVAHEIRNPLTSLRMTIQMLAEKHAGGDPDDQEAYRIILGEIDRLALSVEELLTLANPRPPQLTPVDINKLAQDTVTFLSRQFQHARVEVVVEADPAMPAAIQLDPNKIQQLLVNLLLNAMQSMVQKGNVTLSTQWNPTSSTAILKVQDDGPGIPEELHGRVFELFVSTKEGGGGLGLAVAKQVVEEHGGNISFNSSPKGTTFHIQLPTRES